MPQSDRILPVINNYIAAFEKRGLRIYMTRDWHPPDHCSFKEYGGPGPRTAWPAPRRRLSTELKFSLPFTIVSKATTSDHEVLGL